MEEVNKIEQQMRVMMYLMGGKKGDPPEGVEKYLPKPKPKPEPKVNPEDYNPPDIEYYDQEKGFLKVTKSGKCPHCLQTGTIVRDFGGSVWTCMTCGSTFPASYCSTHDRYYYGVCRDCYHEDEWKEEAYYEEHGWPEDEEDEEDTDYELDDEEW